MADDDLQLNEVSRDELPVGEPLQESVVGDVAAVASAAFTGLSLARNEIAIRRERSQLMDEMAALRLELDIERRMRLVQTYGLEALDDYDGSIDLCGFDPEPFRGFGVDEY